MLVGHPRLNKRQRVLLALLKALGGNVSHTDFQKLLFLYCQETRGERPYEFVPYKYGPFSFTSYADRRKLVEMELVSDNQSQFRLNPRATAVAARLVDWHIKSFAARYVDLRGDSLLELTYERYPSYAWRSEILERILGDDEIAMERISAERPEVKPQTLFTIGYEGRSFENYLNLLISEGISLLCDVRSNAVSRKYGFSKPTLENICHELDIDYIHFPELGIRSERRRSVSNAVDYARLFGEYERHVLPAQHEATQDIAHWVLAGEGVALTCFERLPAECHRSRLASSIERRCLNGERTIHL